jgi:hypothetical protein
MCPSIWMATNEGIAVFPVYSKSMKINLLASVRRLGQAGMGHKRDFCPNRECQQDGSFNPSLDGTHWAVGFRPLPAGSGGAVRGAVWQPVPSGDPHSTLECGDPIATELRLFPGTRSLTLWYLHGPRFVFSSFPFQFREGVLGGNYLHERVHSCLIVT